jgi:hypothetical protein
LILALELGAVLVHCVKNDLIKLAVLDGDLDIVLPAVIVKLLEFCPVNTVNKCPIETCCALAAGSKSAESKDCCQNETENPVRKLRYTLLELSTSATRGRMRI